MEGTETPQGLGAPRNPIHLWCVCVGGHEDKT